MMQPIKKVRRSLNKLNFQDETGVNMVLSFNHFFIQAIGREGQTVGSMRVNPIS